MQHCISTIHASKKQIINDDPIRDYGKVHLYNKIRKFIPGV